MPLNSHIYPSLIEKMNIAAAFCEIVTDQNGEPVDLTYREVNPAFEKRLGLSRQDVVNRRATELFPKLRNDPANWIQIYGDAALHGKEVSFDEYSQDMEKWYHVSVYSPEKPFFVIMFEDIDERKKTEEALRQSEERLRLAQTTAKVGIWDWNLRSGEVYWTPELEKIYGVEPGGVRVYEDFRRRVHPTDLARMEKLREEAVAQHRGFDIEFRILQPNGNIVWLDALGGAVYDEAGVPVRVFGVNIDITERKKAEEELREAKGQYDLLFSSITEGFANYRAVYDKDGILQDLLVIDINPAGAAQSGVKREEQVGKTWRQVWQAIPEEAFDVYRQVDETGKAQSLEHFSPITNAWYIITVNSIAKGQFAATFFDITERKKSQEALQKEKTILQEVMNGAENVHLVYLDRDFNFVRVNEAYAKTCGYKPEEMIGKNHFALYPHEENEAIFKRVRDTGVPAQFHDKPFVFPDQTERGVTFWDWTLKPVKDGSGQVEGLVFSLVETTERKKAEAALFSSEKRYRRLFETSQDGIMARDLNGCMIDCNQAYAKMVGSSKEDLMRLPVEELLPEKWHEQRNRIFREVLETGDSAVFEREYRRKDGVVFPASVRSWRLTDENGKIIGVWSIVRDITRQKELERKLQDYAANLEQLVKVRTMQLRDAERLATIGSTAGMVGHDIRNPLQAIVGDLYLAKSDLAAMAESEEKGGLQESLAEIEMNVEYIDKIVQDLQDFAKPLNPAARETDLEEVCNEVLFKSEIEENVEVSCEVQDEARKLVSDPDLLKRILSNLVSNSVQAMPMGGKLMILAFKDANEVVITVEDTGVGIPEEVRPKLFTPLFTTKAKGQGFGLAVIKRMTEALGGSVTFESEVDKGTKFIVRLPQKS